MRRPAYHRDHPGLDVTMTPMIDVVFLLLIFFVWTASFQVLESILPSSVISSEAAAGQTEPPPEVFDLERIVLRGIRLNDRTAWTLNDQPMDDLAQVRRRLALLRDQMRQLGAELTELPVVLDADGGVPLGEVVDVYDLCRLEGYGKVQFAARSQAPKDEG